MTDNNKQNRNEESFIDTMLGKVAHFFVPTIQTKDEDDLIDRELNNEQQSAYEMDSNKRISTPTSPVSIQSMRVKKNQSIFDSHSYNHSQLPGSSPPNTSSSSLPSNNTSYLQNYFGKHEKQSNIDEIRKGILVQEASTLKSDTDNVTSGSEIDEFVKQVQEMSRETFEQQNNSVTSLKHILLITQELDKLEKMGNVEEDITLPYELTRKQQQEASRVNSSTYDEFLSDLQYIKEARDHTEVQDGETFSIAGNAEIQLEKESQHPDAHLPNNFDLYSRPSIDQKLFSQVKQQMNCK